MLSEQFVEELKGLFDQNRSVVEGCHLWEGSMYDRYGLIYVPSLKISLYAHRVSLMIETRDNIPKGMLVCHKCDVTRCVNPEHLFIGTAKDNQQDMKAKGRSLAGSKNGNSQLGETEVLEIYAAVDRGETYKSQAIKFGVSATHIRRIARGESWEYLYNERGLSNA